MATQGDVVDVSTVLEEFFSEADPEKVDKAFAVAVYFLSRDIPRGGGVAYNGHHLVRADADYLIVDIFNGGRLVDRVFPHHIGSARAFAEFIDRAMAGTAERPPMWRQAARQRSEMN